MSDDKRVIAYHRLPTHPPINTTISAYLILDKFNAPDLIWGLVGGFIILLWIGYIANLASQETTDVFK